MKFPNKRKPAAGGAGAGFIDPACRQYNAGRAGSVPSRPRLRGSNGSQIVRGRLAAPAIGDNVKGHFLTLVEAPQTSALYGADMNENVIAALIRLDEAKAFLAVEPFHGSGLHR
jgi:hypothetical protein